MKFGNLSKLMTAIVVATTFQLFSVAKLTASNVFVIIGLTPNNTLARLGNPTTTPVTGIDGNLIGIDFRPKNGQLYGITDTDKIYIINPNNGRARYVSTLSVRFNGRFQSGVDFNPVADRLRVVGSNDQNFRINVDTGAVTVDRRLDAPGDVDPNITAAAYTNSRAGASSTELYDIDSEFDILVRQNPPNDGILTEVGPLGIDFAPRGGFDIFTDRYGNNYPFAVSGSSLYTINLDTGAATKLFNMPSNRFVGLAVTLSH